VCKQDDASLLFGRLFNNTSSTAKVIQLWMEVRLWMMNWEGFRRTVWSISRYQSHPSISGRSGNDRHDLRDRDPNPGPHEHEADAGWLAM
jgi:hypothetical protein